MYLSQDTKTGADEFIYSAPLASVERLTAPPGTPLSTLRASGFGPLCVIYTLGHVLFLNKTLETRNLV